MSYQHMKINALVVEDEVAAAKSLVKMIRETDPDIYVAGITDSVQSTLRWLSENSDPDLIFLDIHLADGSGFKIIEQADIKSPVIFTTAYDQYAVQAFKVNSVDYLLKPIKREYRKQRKISAIQGMAKPLIHLPVAQVTLYPEIVLIILYSGNIDYMHEGKSGLLNLYDADWNLI